MSEIVVHQLPGAWGLPSVSPFCLKLDAYLRIVDLPYRTVVDATPFGGPKGKLPWIEHEGRRIGDSGFIIDHLSRAFDRHPDAHASAYERAVAHAARRLVEEHLYWVLVYDRWMVEEHWATFRDVVLGGVPGPARGVLAPVARRGVRKQLEGHGLGLHAREEIDELGRRDLRALADLLGDRRYFMGESATAIDASVYGLVANVIRVPLEGPFKEAALAHGNLVAFVDRMKETYFG